MDNAGYTALAGQVAYMNRQKVEANNIVISTIPGAKRDGLVFTQYLYSDAIQKRGNMPVDKQTFTDYTQGALKFTGNDFDIAIAGSGFFMVRTPHGIRYTRNGQFTKNVNGILVTKVGYPVLSQEEGEIVFEPGDSSFVIKANGSVFIDGNPRYVLGIVDFSDLSKLYKEGNDLFIADTPIQEVNFENTTVHHKTLESPNIEQINSLMLAIEAERHVGYVSSILKSNSEMLNKAYKVISSVE